MRPSNALLALALAAPLAAADAGSQPRVPRLVGQLLVGTAGVEIGAAAEWTFTTAAAPLRLRPELLINDRPLPGIGAAVLWGLAGDRLNPGHELFVGPRLVHHNNRRDKPDRDGDRLEYGLEFGALGQYVFPIVPTRPGEHWIEVLLGAGIVDHDDDWDPAITVGAGYGYQF